MRDRFVLLLIAALGVIGGVAAGSPVRGDWHGTLDTGTGRLAIGVRFTDDGAGTVTVPEQGIVDAPLAAVRTDPEQVEFAIPGIPGDPTFRGRQVGGDRIDGQFSQGDRTLPLSFERGPVMPAPRPQEPRPPYPYRVEDVSYRSGDITIAGTLTRPNAVTPAPAVLLISGSGPQDRDETILGHKPFLLLADTLTRAGYAVLRVDDRGVGGTSGSLDDSTYADLAGDVAAGVRFLRTHSGIDPARVGLLGHSEGGYLAPLVATAPDSGVAFVIGMAAPSVPGVEVLIEQNRQLGIAAGASPEQIDEQVRFVTELAGLLRAGDDAGAGELIRRRNDEAPEGQRVPDAALAAYLSPYFAELVRYDPGPALRALRVPMFAFYGSKDLQVPSAQNEGPMRDALAGDPDHTVVTFPGLNHLMQPAQTGLPSEYGAIETTIAPEVLAGIVAWLVPRFAPALG